MIHQTHLSLPDGRYGILYRFPVAGAGLPMHSHVGETEVLRHDIWCTAGQVQVHLPEGRAVVLSPGQALVDGEDFDGRLPHEIVALVDGSHVLNVMKYGRPEGYEKLPRSELDGSVELGPLTIGIS